MIDSPGPMYLTAVSARSRFWSWFQLPRRLTGASGEEKQVKTSARTVKQLFEEENIKVGKEDRLNVKESDPIADGAKIVLDYVSTKEEKVEQAIAYGTETQYSDSIEFRKLNINEP